MTLTHRLHPVILAALGGLGFQATAPLSSAKDATPVTVTASSEELGKKNFAWRAVDNDPNTRWCAEGPGLPQWLQLEFDKPQTPTGCKIVWESQNNAYQHLIEGSADGKKWIMLADARTNQKAGATEDSFPRNNDTPVVVRFLRITCTGTSQRGWASIKDVSLTGDGIAVLTPKTNAMQQVQANLPTAKAGDTHSNEGNVPPRIEKLSPEKEAGILKDVKVADGFDATLFAAPPAVNYPVFVAAAPDGTLYVASDGNGSLGRNPHRGRIIRLRDLDGDGRADETKVFCEVDAPRGLVWDHDRLYLVHPPDLSVYIDKDGDGIADEEKVLVKGIAFGYDQRPADHTTNGLSLGIDGWLYIAGGDFGFMDAVGTDGRHLQHRGGGVIRVRPDGTGLEIYSTGTRNILEVAISPLMDIFARDNTNDGGGWDVRFHHFTGLDDHGYPRLFKNFNDECIQPLADYGGGSGCGAVYIDEPGFGKWNNAPFTCDWGTGALWHHSVKAKGATFEETEKPQPFIRMTRPTDADVDAMSRVYCASWKGATFNWEGPDVGYIVCVKPKGWTLKGSVGVSPTSVSNSKHGQDARAPFVVEPLPDFNRVSEKDLVLMLDLSKPQSYRRRIEAQRELMRRGSKFARIYDRQFADARTGERNLVANLKDKASDDEVILVIAHPDPIIAHTAIRAAAARNLHPRAFKAMDDPNRVNRGAILRALAMMHQPEVVTGLIERLGKTTDSALRQGILATLCRLHFKEGEWKGDSWGTRPDTTGPYYQPEPWSETPRIAAALKDALGKASPEEAAFLVNEMTRNRIQSDDALNTVLAMAAKDAKLIPAAVGQLSKADTIPAAGVPVLIQAVQGVAGLQPASPGASQAEAPRHSDAVLAQAIIAIAKSDSADAIKVALAALTPLSRTKTENRAWAQAREAFLTAPKLENHHQILERTAAEMNGDASVWADACLLNLAARKGGSPEAREMSAKALNQGWTNPKRRLQMLAAMRVSENKSWADKVLAAAEDADRDFAKAAEQTVKALRLEKRKTVKDDSPLLATLKLEEIVATIMKTHGDVKRGEELFTRQTCIACHTTGPDQPLKGPYLGNIAQTYKRNELAENILNPNKTIAQGFQTNLFTLKDGTQQMGFVVQESADKVTVRNIAAQELTYATKDIAKRERIEPSLMPPGLVLNITLREFASLLDYLESLAKK